MTKDETLKMALGVTHCQCEACKNGNIHDSDCSVHNGDALPVGPCDCSLATPPLPVQEQQQAEPPPEWLLIKNILDEYGLQAIDFVADWKAAQRPWVGLTDEEMSDIVADIDVDFGDLLWKVVCLTKIIEATLKERNT